MHRSRRGHHDSFSKHGIAIGFAVYLQRTKNKQFFKNKLPPMYAAYLRLNGYPEKYNVFAITTHLRERNIVSFLRGKMLLKPVAISTDNEVFSVSKVVDGATNYFVCMVCNRGCESQDGINQHRVSDGHKQSIYKYKITTEADGDGVWHCPILSCQYACNSETDLGYHLDRASHQQIKQCIPDYQNDPVSVLQQNGHPQAPPMRYPCLICGISCTSQRNLDDHKGGKKHRLKEFRLSYRKNRQSLMRDKGGLHIYPDIQLADGGNFVEGILNLTTERDRIIADFNIENRSSEHIEFTACSQYGFCKNVVLDDAEGITQNSRYAQVLDPGEVYKVNVRVNDLVYGTSRIPIMFTFKKLQKTVYLNVVKEVMVRRVSDRQLYTAMEPTTPYTGKKEPVVVDDYGVVIDGIKPSSVRDDSLALIHKLNACNPPDDIVRAMNTKNIASKTRLVIAHKLELDDLEFCNYSDHFNTLIHLEELQMEMDIQMYTMENVTMRREGRSSLMVLIVPGLAENRPSVLKGDKLFASIHSANDERRGKRYAGYVHHVGMEDVKLGFNKALLDKHIDGQRYTIEFTVNRLPIMLEHRAVTWGAEHERGLEHTLFPDMDRQLPPLVNVSQLQFFNAEVGKNEQQKLAVEQIVTGSSRPAPYLIFGPPGTGKTVTVVEAIKQVYTVFRHGVILACAPQNNAADLLAERLMSHIDQAKIIRLNAASRSINSIINTKVQQISNYRSSGSTGAAMAGITGRSRQQVGNEVYFPPLDVLKKYKVIVCTLVTAGRLVSAGMDGHFSHIFIDEAGHATEPETAIALAGLLDVNQKKGGQLVLAGDPKQLGPIIRSRMAEKYNLGMSLLERLMSNEDAYQRDGNAQFDVRVVTKLLKSFRSHPNILKVPNDCFYDNELMACADKQQRERFCRWEGLPKQDFPLIFHGIKGVDQREGNSPSWFNADEVVVVINYIAQLMEIKSPSVKPEHIGIISPYRKQVEKIRRALEVEDRRAGRNRRLKDINVGSVEVFQGEERPIIIISTVRSTDEYVQTMDAKFSLGFVKNPKRFNVALTRAKALLIVVGNPAVLCQEEHWREFITYCQDKGGYAGIPPPAEDDELPDELSEQMDALNLNEDIPLEMGVSEIQQQVAPEWQRRD